MKIFVTGCTSSQASTKAASRYPTAGALITKALESHNIDVTFSEPSVDTTQEELNEYDLVLVGVASPGSLGASKTYGAFSVGNKARKNGNLALFIDAPEPYKIYAGLKNLQSSPKNLKKDFYKSRAGYKEYVSDPRVEREVNDFLYYLNYGEWPTTFYTSLPWTYPDEIHKELPTIPIEKIVPMNLDKYLLTASSNLVEPEEVENKYFVSDTLNTKWVKKTQRQLVSSVVKTKESKWDDVLSVQYRISKAVGTLAPIYRSNHAWWSPSIALSLSLGVPVATDWTKSKVLGDCWSFLPSAVESLSSEERVLLASAQAEEYRKAVTHGGEKFVSDLDFAKSAVTS